MYYSALYRLHQDFKGGQGENFIKTFKNNWKIIQGLERIIHKEEKILEIVIVIFGGFMFSFSGWIQTAFQNQ